MGSDPRSWSPSISPRCRARVRRRSAPGTGSSRPRQLGGVAATRASVGSSPTGRAWCSTSGGPLARSPPAAVGDRHPRPVLPVPGLWPGPPLRRGPPHRPLDTGRSHRQSQHRAAVLATPPPRAPRLERDGPRRHGASLPRPRRHHPLHLATRSLGSMNPRGWVGDRQRQLGLRRSGEHDDQGRPLGPEHFVQLRTRSTRPTSRRPKLGELHARAAHVGGQEPSADPEEGTHLPELGAVAVKMVLRLVRWSVRNTN